MVEELLKRDSWVDYIDKQLSSMGFTKEDNEEKSNERMNLVIDLIDKNIITLEQVAAKAEVTVDDLENILKLHKIQNSK